MCGRLSLKRVIESRQCCQGKGRGGADDEFGGKELFAGAVGAAIDAVGEGTGGCGADGEDGVADGGQGGGGVGPQGESSAPMTEMFSGMRRPRDGRRRPRRRPGRPDRRVSQSAVPARHAVFDLAGFRERPAVLGVFDRPRVVIA